MPTEENYMREEPMMSEALNCNVNAFLRIVYDCGGASDDRFVSKKNVRMIVTHIPLAQGDNRNVVVSEQTIPEGAFNMVKETILQGMKKIS